MDTARGLFVSDLDATLLGPDRKLPRRNHEAIRHAVERGVMVAIVSGRRLSSMRGEYPKLDGLRYRVATSNGSVVLAADNQTPESVKGLGWELVDRVTDASELIHAPMIVITAPRPAENGTEPPDTYVLEPHSRRWLSSLTPFVIDTLEPVEAAAVRLAQPVHLAFRLDTRDEADALAEWASEWLPADTSRHVVRNPIGEGALLELVPRGGKGLALEYLAKVMGLSHEATGAIGDELNDCDLLDAAAHRYAVGGSILAARRPDARAVSSAQAGAVADALEDFLGRL